jgi:murein DD-endopeptidase MepM/ murein hydrolase activator NlpD
VSLSADKPAVLGPPLRGSNWLALNGPSNTSGHRRALAPFNGRLHISQRFAIDWVKVDNNATFSGEPKDNKAYFAYGNEILAVANATVSKTKDGVPENIPGDSRAVPITAETIAGNYVVLDLGSGRFAFYGHLQPGSLRVKPGDNVRRGQVLGLVGNSGNSDEPHLHFQVGDSDSLLGSEGLPYVLASFEVLGPVAPGSKSNALPLQNALVKFPPSP